jgi:hypothetical protein
MGSNVAFVFCDRLDVHKRPSQFDDIHRCPLGMEGSWRQARERRARASLLDSAPSRLAGMTVDWPFSPSPNRTDSACRNDFGGETAQLPFHPAVRSCSELPARLLMASAPLPGTTLSLWAAAKQVKQPPGRLTASPRRPRRPPQLEKGRTQRSSTECVLRGTARRK